VFEVVLAVGYFPGFIGRFINIRCSFLGQESPKNQSGIYKKDLAGCRKPFFPNMSTTARFIGKLKNRRGE